MQSTTGTNNLMNEVNTECIIMKSRVKQKFSNSVKSKSSKHKVLINLFVHEADHILKNGRTQYNLNMSALNFSKCSKAEKDIIGQRK